MHTAEQVKAHADVMELAEVDFLRKDGSYWKGRGRLNRVRIMFIDETVFTLSAAEWRKMAEYSFRLRPSKDNA